MSSKTIEIVSDESLGSSELPAIYTNKNIIENTNTQFKDAEIQNKNMAETSNNKKRPQGSQEINNINKRNKIYKPGECMKYMVVEMHPVLLESWYCADVARELSARGARVNTSSALFDPALVLFSISEQPRLANVDGMVGLSAVSKCCGHCLYVSRVEDIEKHVQSRSLSKHIGTVASLANCKVTLLIFGAKSYFKNSSRKIINNSRKLITEIELEMAITDLVVSCQCDTVMVNTPNELALVIAQTAKALAEAPYKKAKRELDEQADFYMRGDNKKCVSVDKDGNGLSNLWQQMVAILPLSCLETSRALCAEFRTPRALYQALGVSGAGAVSAVGVSRAAAPGSRARRVGPEFARKLHTLFTATDGNALIQ